MKPVDQRLYQPHTTPLRGDCLAACIASIFELELAEVPHFVDLDYRTPAAERAAGRHWHSMVNEWAWDFGIGYNLIRYPARRKPKYWHPGWWIASVKSRCEPDATHAVVMWGSELKHDPNPRSRAVADRYWFVGEGWFELGEPAHWAKQIDWRALFAYRLSEDAS